MYVGFTVLILGVLLCTCKVLYFKACGLILYHFVFLNVEKLLFLCFNLSKWYFNCLFITWDVLYFCDRHWLSLVLSSQTGMYSNTLSTVALATLNVTLSNTTAD